VPTPSRHPDDFVWRSRYPLWPEFASWGTVRAENQSGSGRDLVHGLYEGHPALCEVFYDVAIVNDLVKNIDGRSIPVERSLHRFDSHLDPGTKTAWLRQNNLVNCQAKPPQIVVGG